MDERNILISQKKLKLLSGGLGVALPELVYLGNLYIFNDHILKSSLSSYYYTHMRDVFVGVLFAIGVFMVAYEGYSSSDRILSNFGGLFAIGVALFPTAPTDVDPSLINNLHLLFAASFFFILMRFCFLFTRSATDRPKTKLKRVRNVFYYMSGFIILISLIFLIAGGFNLYTAPLEHPVFWFEYLGITAFGVAWIIKGEGVFLLNDDPILEMNPWEILGFLILVVLVLGNFLMLSDIFFLA